MNPNKKFSQALFSGWRSRLRWKWAGKGFILALHRVVTEESASYLECNREIEILQKDLKSWVQFFRKKGFEFISIDQVALRQTRRHRFIALTFDDGYKDNLHLALPLLESLDVPFTVGITTSFPDQTAILWWYLFEDLVCREGKVEFPERKFQEMRSELWALDAMAQERYLKSLAERAGLDPYSYVRELALSWDDIRTLAKHPLVTLAAHSVSHVSLKSLSHEQVKWEMEESRRRLEIETELSIRHFVYPFGSPREASLREYQLVQELGFRTGLTTCKGFLSTGEEDLASLPRISLP